MPRVLFSLVFNTKMPFACSCELGRMCIRDNSATRPRVHTSKIPRVHARSRPFDHLTTKSFESQINWQPTHLNLINWQPKSFESHISWQPNHLNLKSFDIQIILTLNSLESDCAWLSNQLNSTRPLPIGSLSLETSAAALCGRYVMI